MTSEKLEKYFLASIVETSQDSIISVDFEMRITSWNKAAEGLYGYPADEVMGKPLTRLTRDQDLKMITAKVKKVRNSKRVELFVTERIGKDNEKLHLEIMMSPIKDVKGTVVGVSTIARDISMRKRAEKADRDREVLRKVLAAHEAERARLARDLHDQLGQEVTALRFMLKSAKDKSKEAHLRSEIDEMESVIAEIDRNIDFIAWELRPAAVDAEASLTSAINNFTRQWSHHTGIPVKRLAPLKSGERLLSIIDTNLYRMMQEALNNIQKHAKATEVDLSLKQRNGFLTLIISDDGKGFNTKRRRTGSRGFGLVGMKERAALIGADLEIESAPGEGTTIYVNVPIPAE